MSNTGNYYIKYPPPPRGTCVLFAYFNELIFPTSLSISFPFPKNLDENFHSPAIIPYFSGKQINCCQPCSGQFRSNFWRFYGVNIWVQVCILLLCRAGVITSNMWIFMHPGSLHQAPPDYFNRGNRCTSRAFATEKKLNNHTTYNPFFVKIKLAKSNKFYFNNLLIYQIIFKTTPWGCCNE